MGMIPTIGVAQLCSGKECKNKYIDKKVIAIWETVLIKTKLWKARFVLLLIERLPNTY